MKLPRIGIFALVLGVLAVGIAGAETYPPGLDRAPENYQELIGDITNSTANPMRLSTQNVPYSGSGAADITFTTNQRATIWVAIYEIGSSDTGPTGINDAVIRYKPQDKHVATVGGTQGISVEQGNNTIKWDGNDWEGNAAGPGTYEFDVIALNNLDPAAFIGLSAGGAMADPVYDMRNGDQWTHIEGPADAGQYWGTLALGKIGNNYLDNPTGYETWNFVEELNTIDNGGTVGGIRPDVDDPNAYYVSFIGGNWSTWGGAGVYRLIRNDAAKTLDRDPNWGDNGYSKQPMPDTEATMAVALWKDKMYTTNWSGADPPNPGIGVWDKTTGEFLMYNSDHVEFYRRYRIDDNGNEAFGNGGTTAVTVDESGMWPMGWRGTQFLKIDHDFNLIWSNGPGDHYGDQISAERAAALGIQGPARNGELALILDSVPDPKSRIAITTPRHNTLGNYNSIYGRDGTGIGQIFLDYSVGPFTQHTTTNVAYINNDCAKHDGDLYCSPNSGSPGPYDGIIVNTGYSIVHHDLHTYEASEPRVPTMGMHLPFAVESGKMGANITAVEEVASAALPESHSLGAAYPNPFNPETAIDFMLANEDQVKIEVFNTTGQLVDTLIDGYKPAGAYKATWNAHNSKGEPVSSGVYFYRMQAGQFSATQAVTLLK